MRTEVYLCENVITLRCFQLEKSRCSLFFSFMVHHLWSDLLQGKLKVEQADAGSSSYLFIRIFYYNS